jgi:hypothetical protein
MNEKTVRAVAASAAVSGVALRFFLSEGGPRIFAALPAKTIDLAAFRSRGKKRRRMPPAQPSPPLEAAASQGLPPLPLGACCWVTGWNQVRVLFEERELVSIGQSHFAAAFLALKLGDRNEPLPVFNFRMAAILAFKGEI